MKKEKKKKTIGRDCSCCDWFKELPNKDLELDFGFCTRPDCEVHYHVLFEHFRCDKAKGIDYLFISGKKLEQLRRPKPL